LHNGKEVRPDAEAKRVEPFLLIGHRRQGARLGAAPRIPPLGMIRSDIRRNRGAGRCFDTPLGRLAHLSKNVPLSRNDFELFQG
jgi:hypothetical protein